MDVYTSIPITMNSLQVDKVPFKAQGPIGKGLNALLIGRSSVTLQGIFVYPAVIDENFTEQIQAIVSTPTPPVTIPAKTKIAQLILFKTSAPKADSREQGDQDFRSTGQTQVY